MIMKKHLCVLQAIIQLHLMVNDAHARTAEAGPPADPVRTLNGTGESAVNVSVL